MGGKFQIAPWKKKKDTGFQGISQSCGITSISTSLRHEIYKFVWTRHAKGMDTTSPHAQQFSILAAVVVLLELLRKIASTTIDTNRISILDKATNPHAQQLSILGSSCRCPRCIARIVAKDGLKLGCDFKQFVAHTRVQEPTRDTSLVGIS